jgi:hypothetical protein
MAKITIFGKEVNYQAYKDGMYQYNMRIRLESDRTFLNVFRRNMTDAFFDMLKKTLDPTHNFEQNIVLSISGLTGCQPKGSKVLLWNGRYKNVENIMLGDEIVTYNKVSECKGIIKKLYKKKEPIYKVTDYFGRNLYFCSESHMIPYWHYYGGYLIKTAKQLSKVRYMYCCVNNTGRIRVVKVVKTKRKEEVYGFSVSGNTGLFVTDNYMVTHNSGKSSVGISLATMTIPERFSDKNICFFDQEILDLAPKLPRDSFIIRDEGVDKATFGVGSQRTSRQLQVLAETCRKAGLNLIFIEPEFRVNEIAKYYLETIDMDIKNRLTRVAIRDSYTKQYMGAAYVPILPKTHPTWVKYNQTKDAFIRSMMEGNMGGAKADYEDIAKTIASEIDLDRFSKAADRLTYIQLKHTNMTNQEHKILHRLLEMELRGKTGEKIGGKKNAKI